MMSYSFAVLTDSSLAGTPTLVPYVTRYLQTRVREGGFNLNTANTVSYRLYRFAASAGQQPLTRLSRATIDKWLTDIEHVAPSTRRVTLGQVRTFCRWLVDEGAIKTDPTRGIRIRKPRSVPRSLNTPQIAALMQALPDQRAILVFRLMVEEGLRCMEVVGLQVDDYDPDRATLRIKGKGGHERVLPVTQATCNTLEMYLGQLRLAGGALVRSQAQPWKGISAGYLSRLVGEWIRDAGIKRRAFDGISAHALRHTAASDVFEHSGDIVLVQKMLGHADISTTTVYLRGANLDAMRAAMEGRVYSPLHAVSDVA